jgi:DNA-binding CsgD family transcriptional regulator
LRWEFRGYLPTRVRADMMIAAIRLALAGGMFVPKRLVMHYLQEGFWQIEAQGPVLFETATAGLTAWEQEITGCPRKRRPNKAIAFDLSIAESMVKIHIRNVMKTMNPANRTQVACCTQLIKPPRAVLAEQPMPSGVTFQPSCDQTGTATGSIPAFDLAVRVGWRMNHPSLLRHAPNRCRRERCVRRIIDHRGSGYRRIGRAANL